jgi:hypothetical protein
MEKENRVRTYNKTTLIIPAIIAAIINPIVKGNIISSGELISKKTMIGCMASY